MNVIVVGLQETRTVLLTKAKTRMIEEKFRMFGFL
jgi:hypothetical protein